MHLGGIGEDAAITIAQDGVRFPSVPVAVDDLHEFVGAIIAQVMIQVLIRTEIRRLGIIERGHDVPGHPTAQHQIHGREEARDVERLVIGGRIGQAQPQFRGGHPHDGRDGRCIELDRANTVFDGRTVVVMIAVRNGQTVIEKGQVELARLQRARNAGVEFGCVPVRHTGLVPP